MSVATLQQQPLPNGWERHTTAQGQIYYVHRPTQTTSWEDPRLVGHTNSVVINDEETPLPPGWEMRIAETGRPYFVNHNDRTTQYADPRRATAAAATATDRDADLPQYKRDFKAKLAQLRRQLVVQQGTCSIPVRREHIFSDAFAFISRAQPTELKKRLNIKFAGEVGLDYSGVAREFFFLLSQVSASARWPAGRWGRATDGVRWGAGHAESVLRSLHLLAIRVVHAAD